MATRLLEIFIATGGLLLLGPLMLALAAIATLKLGRPVLFRQTWLGLRGAPFEPLKIWTMTFARRPDAALLSDTETLRRLGRMSPVTSLDKRSGLRKVMRGDMSLVNPRPLLVDYVPPYAAKQARGTSIGLGITRWAQVNGRNSISRDSRCAFDLCYVNHRSFALDPKIFLAAGLRAIARQVINTNDNTPAPLFAGSSRDGRGELP